MWALDRPVQVISMDGAFQRVSPGEIEKAVAPYAHAGFMSADLDDIQRAVEALPWVEHARVKRRWPNSLHVTVIEETAAARWGESGLLNTRGELFVREAAHVPAELPRLSGPEGTQNQVAQRYMAIQGRMLEAGMRIAALRLDERGAWEMDLDSGVTVRLGRRDVDERIDRFIRTASQVIAHRLERNQLRGHALFEWLCHRLAHARGTGIGARETLRRHRCLKEPFKNHGQAF